MLIISFSSNLTAQSPILESANDTASTSPYSVIHGTIGSLINNNGTIEGYIVCNGKKIPFNCTARWYYISSNDYLNGTLIADIENDFSGTSIVNISVGKNREAALSDNRSFDTNDTVLKVALYDTRANIYYSAVSSVSTLLLSEIRQSALTISKTSNSVLYSNLIQQEKWYNIIFREQKLKNNVMTFINDIDVKPLISSEEQDNRAISGFIPVSFEKFLSHVGEAKFQTANRTYNPGVVTSGNSYYGFYMETFENFDSAIVSYVIYYAVTPNISRMSDSTDDGFASISLTISHNHEIWYYPSTGQYLDMGECQYRMRNVGVSLSLSGNNTDFIWRMYEEANISNTPVQIPTFGVNFIPVYGQYISVGLDIFNSITNHVNGNVSGTGRTCSFPLTPTEHFDQCEGYLRQVTSKLEQGFNNNWFSDAGDSILLEATLYSDNSNTAKTITYNVTYEVCFPNAIGWYNTIATVNDQFNKSY